MNISAAPSYLYATVRQFQSGLEQYGFRMPNYSVNFLDTELKKPNSQLKNHIFNAIANEILAKEVQEYSWLMEHQKEKLAHARAEADAEEEYEHERAELIDEPELLEKFEPEKTSDIELAKLREQQTNLSEQYDELAQYLYEQLGKQAAETEKFHQTMVESFAKQSTEAEALMSANLADLKAEAASTTSPEKKEQLQTKIKSLEEVVDDFKESMRRDSVAMKSLLMDIKNSQDPVEIMSKIHKHINLQEFKLKMLENQLKTLEAVELTERVSGLSQQYANDYSDNYKDLQQQIQSTKNLIQQMKEKEAEIKLVNEKIENRENVLSAAMDQQPYEAPTTTKPTVTPEEKPSQGPTI